MKFLRTFSFPFLKNWPSLLAGVVLGFGLGSASAQSPRAAEANQVAYDLYLQGNYEEALTAYQQLLRDYPTDILVPLATVQTGFANFFLGNFPEAIAILEKAETDPTTPAELRPVVAAFIPQVYAAKAAALEPGDANRKAAFEEAITKFSEYLEKYPNEPGVENARFGRALAKYQIQEFEAAAADLEENLKQFPNSPTIQDSQNLLALTLATLGSMELSKGAAGDRAAGLAKYERAKQLLQGIIEKGTNLALVNDARFQLAEILFSEAAFAPEEERPPLYAKAMEAYRAVLPNEEMIALQEELLATFPERRRRVLTNRVALANLDREIDREQRRLAEMRAKPDMIATSRLKLGEIYFNQGELNKARVVLRHVTPFLTKDEDKMRAQYFLTLSYILQNQADRAVANYDIFQETHKAEPIAQNLPLAMGNMFLGHPDPLVRDIDLAIKYFDESLEIYPEGALAGLTTVSKATALVSQNQVAEAEKTFQDFLAGDPTPEEAIVARMGLGDIYIRTQQWDKAIEMFESVVRDFPDRPQVADARYWIAMSTQQKGDPAAALPLLQALRTDFPDNPFQPNVIIVIAQAQAATGDRETALVTLVELAENYPDSIPAPFSYFLRAQLLAQGGETAEANEVMRAFIEKYPDNERVFAAFDWLGQAAYRDGEWDDAIGEYTAFVDRYPEDPNAPAALLRVAEYAKQWAERLGRFGALTTDEQAVWQERMQMSIDAAERMIANYPQSELLPQGIQNYIAAQEALIAAEIQAQNDLELKVKTMAEGAPDATTRSKLLFGLASWLSRQDSGRALETMQEAFDPNVIYAPADLDVFGLALLEDGQMEEAEKVFQKLLADYPNPDGVEPTAAPPLTQHAQANALFGMARIAQERGQTAEAGQKFAQLKELYPWSSKVLEADLGIAQAEFAAGQLDAALARLPGLIRSPNATADVRAKAMLLGGEIMEKRFETAGDAKSKDEALAAAIDYYIKIDQFYSGVPAIAAEGLWRGGQLLERQAAGASDQSFRQRQINQARRAYQDLISRYPNSPHVERAQGRVSALGT
jgi:TolA-binding protein